MDSLRQVQQHAFDLLGEDASVDAWSSDGRKVYACLVPQRPMNSDSATRIEAWATSETLAFVEAHASLFEPDSKLEVIVGFTNSVRTTKRRIFRVGAPLGAIGTLKAQRL